MNFLQFTSNTVAIYNSFSYIVFMKTNNAITLHIHIAENGDRAEKERICKAALLSETTLNKILRGHMPRFEVRYRIFKATGIKLNEQDEFPDIQKQNAS